MACLPTKIPVIPSGVFGARNLSSILMSGLEERGHLNAHSITIANPLTASSIRHVLSSPKNAVNPFSSRPASRFPCLFFFCFLFLTLPSPADTTSLDDAVHQLADRVASIPNLHGPLHLVFLLDSSFAPDTAKEWQTTFRNEMVARSLVLTDDPNAPLLRVGISETPTQLVLSASARIADKDEVRFLTFPRASFRTASLPVVPIRIERQLVYSTPDRILDASSFWNGAETGMAVLLVRGAEFSVVRLDSSGQPAQTIPLPAANRSPSRDPRGQLTVHPDGGSVLVSDQSCDFTWLSSAVPSCRPAKSEWRTPTVLTPSCDSGGWKLLADGGDWTTADVLQVLPDAALRQGSAALLSDFPGPILSVSGEQNPASALVVTKNLQIGNYEIYKITLACGN